MNVSDEENVILETPYISSSLERHILVFGDDITMLELFHLQTQQP
jgi:hypothetical protein